MNNVQLDLRKNNEGTFFISENGNQIAEMEFSIRGNLLTVYHTEVDEKEEGKGIAKELLEAMVAHAREHNLKVVPLCAYVHAQFQRHEDEYADVWKKQEDE